MAQKIHSLYQQTTAATEKFREAFALDVLVGLSEARKAIPSIYHYDAEGSRLFNKITTLPEYYPTGCEADVLSRNKERLARIVGEGPLNLIEFGSGDGNKTQIIIDHFLQTGIDFQYVPIDISHTAMEGMVAGFSERYPSLEINGLVADYFAGLKWLNHRFGHRHVVLFLGSNIGNFRHDEARQFLRNLWLGLNDRDIVLIGFDRKKEIGVLLKAYNDSEGVTAEFNLNLLRRINRELGGEFDPTTFQFYGTYDVVSGAIESYLISLIDQDVRVKELGRSFHFDRWEPIHTEYSYKYHESDIASLASDTGYEVIEHLYDTRRYFADSIWEVHKVPPENNDTAE